MPTDTSDTEGRTATPDNSEAWDRSWPPAQTWHRMRGLVMKSVFGALLSDVIDTTL